MEFYHLENLYIQFQIILQILKYLYTNYRILQGDLFLLCYLQYHNILQPSQLDCGYQAVDLILALILQA